MREEAPPVARTITVPNVMGLSLEVARNVLGEAGFRGTEAGTALTTDPAQVNNVMSQSPVGETQAPPGSDVSLVIGHREGPPPQTPPGRKVMVPDVVGKSIEDAQVALSEAGLDAKVVGHQDTSDPALQDQVVHQAPPGGTELPRGNHVNLRLYRIAGAPPGRKVMVPDVVGRSLEDAQVALGQAGLDAKVVGRQDTLDPALADQVVHQAPPGGTELPDGNHVNLRLYRFAVAQLVDVHRWFHPASGDHFYTTDPSGELAPSSGYTNEGVAGYVLPAEGAAPRPSPSLLPVPNVQNDPLEVAERKLREAGLEAKVVGNQGTRDAALKDRVAVQAPGAGARVSRGSVVDLTLYSLVAPTPPARATPPRVSWTPGASIPTPRFSPHAAAIDGLLYVVGGHDSRADTPVLEVYNPSTATWKSLASLPRAGSGNLGRYGGVVGVINDKIYLVGGWRISPPLPTGTLHIYDPKANSWTRGASIPVPPSRLSACSAGGVIDGKLYVLTACNGHSGFFKFFHVYDPGQNRWTQLRDAPNIHADAAAGVIGGKFYVAGGGIWGNPSAALDVYDPGTNNWTTHPSMPTARSAVTAAVINDRIYVVGGHDGNNPVGTMEVLDRVGVTLPRGLGRRPPRRVPVPDVLNQTLPQANQMLAQAGLQGVVGGSQETPDSSLSEKVAVQAPEAGAQVTPGSSVNLTLYRGPVSVPNVEGQALAGAATLLTSRGLDSRVAFFAETCNQQRHDTVADQDPRADTSVKWGTVVELTEYRLNPDNSTVPDVRNQIFAEAQRVLINAGFQAQEATSYVPTKDQNVSRHVAGQGMGPNSCEKRGTVVPLTLYRFVADQATVPDVTNKNISDARRILQGLGFSVEEGEFVNTTDWAQHFMVARQSPAPNEVAAPGKTVVRLAIYWSPDVGAIVPDLAKRSVDEARAMLSPRGYQYRVDGYVSTSDQSLHYRVASQSPGPDARLNPGNTVGVRLYSYSPGGQIIVPDVSNENINRAMTLLGSAGLAAHPAAGSVDTHDPNLRNLVARQDPAPNTRVNRGTDVGLVMYRFVANVVVPNVFNEPLTDAQSLLTDRGLRYRVDGRIDTPNRDLDGRVATQTPPPDVTVDVEQQGVIRLQVYRHTAGSVDEIVVPNVVD